ncbi:MAG TPA: hypothetical protein VE128_00680 [Candidatus Angelobacter sp.]|nr:hypothetical protein [Candidatus Angelobacter sp.]
MFETFFFKLEITKNERCFLGKKNCLYYKSIYLGASIFRFFSISLKLLKYKYIWTIINGF